MFKIVVVGLLFLSGCTSPWGVHSESYCYSSTWQGVKLEHPETEVTNHWGFKVEKLRDLNTF